MIIVVMGVSGSGKTTIGSLLAKRLGYRFYEGDDFHSEEHIEKMASGIPLSDEDRAPWLIGIRTVMEQCRRSGTNAVIACSALRQSHRSYLCDEAGDVRFVYLKGDYEFIRERMSRRHSHFMKHTLLESQYSILEEPIDAIIAEVTERPQAIVAKIEEELLADRWANK